MVVGKTLYAPGFSLLPSTATKNFSKILEWLHSFYGKSYTIWKNVGRIYKKLTETFLGPYQTSLVEAFAKIFNNF